MPYISTELNRLYAALESSFGSVPAPVPGNAFRALRSTITAVQEYLARQDKTGSRSAPGIAAGGRRHAKFEVQAYLIPSGAAGSAPNMGPFFQAACGGAPQIFAGGTVAPGSTASSVLFTAAHGLSVGQAVGSGPPSGKELRFVVAVPSSTAVTVDPPFSSAPAAGSSITGTVTYPLGDTPPSLSLFEYWTPSTAQQRLMCGGSVDTMEVDVSGDFHVVKFSGLGQDVIDSITFANGQGGGLTAFPSEPSSQSVNGSALAGHLGQVWLGAPASRFATLSTAKLQLQNGMQMRGNEFGSTIPLAAQAGQRKVGFDFDVFQLDDAATAALYSAAMAHTPVTAFVQLGTVAGSMFGVYMSKLMPQVPANDPGQKQLVWKFSGSRAGDGTANAEIFVAFG